MWVWPGLSCCGDGSEDESNCHQGCHAVYQHLAPLLAAFCISVNSRYCQSTDQAVKDVNASCRPEAAIPKESSQSTLGQDEKFGDNQCTPIAWAYPLPPRKAYQPPNCQKGIVDIVLSSAVFVVS
jgi:hypothetical protein